MHAPGSLACFSLAKKTLLAHEKWRKDEMAAGINFSTTYYMSRSCSLTFRLMLTSVFSRFWERGRRIKRPTRPCPVYQYSGSDDRGGGGGPRPGGPGGG